MTEEQFEDISACWECSVKHVTCARIEYFEYLQDNESVRDLVWCIGDLACAEKHLISLEPDLADMVRLVRKKVMGDGISLGEFDQMVLMICSYAGMFKKDLKEE